MANVRETTMARQRFQVGTVNGDATPPPIADNRQFVDDNGFQLGLESDDVVTPPPISDSRRLNGNQRYQAPSSNNHAVPVPPPKHESRQFSTDRMYQPMAQAPAHETIPSPAMENARTLDARSNEQRGQDARQYQAELQNGHHNGVDGVAPSPVRRPTEERRFQAELQNGHHNGVDGVAPSPVRRPTEERRFQGGPLTGEEEHLPIMNNTRMSDDQTSEIAIHSGDAMISPSSMSHANARSEAKGYFGDTISISKASAVSDASSRFADFFGTGIFQIVLHNPTTAHQLLKFSQARFCGENMEFLEKLDRYMSLLNELTTTMTDIHRNYISPNAHTQINLSADVMKTVHVGMKTSITSTLPAMESIFVEAQDKIEQLVSTDIYPRFVRYQMTMSATKALASDRGKFQGLGDCFCLTNPSKADNPIVYASDGFVKVTGYSRRDIIPRNCRFLQGRHTDRTPIRRLKACIEAKEESVELILNYKKNGEPFWNLLYVAPLYNADGNVAFFIGGQINCSTTIHSNSDVLRILATSDEPEEAEKVVPGAAVPRNPSTFGRKGFLSAFRSNSSRKASQAREAGMEQSLLNRIERLDLKTQMNAFYTAYSKYIVVRYDSFVINFYSAGISDMLNPTNLTNSQMIGTDIFRFFSNNATQGTRDYKSRVRSALKMGMAISVDIHLETRRSLVYRGDERFATHWTPVKDENGAVQYVVVTMGSTANQL